MADDAIPLRVERICPLPMGFPLGFQHTAVSKEWSPNFTFNPIARLVLGGYFSPSFVTFSARFHSGSPGQGTILGRYGRIVARIDLITVIILAIAGVKVVPQRHNPCLLAWVVHDKPCKKVSDRNMHVGDAVDD